MQCLLLRLSFPGPHALSVLDLVWNDWSFHWTHKSFYMSFASDISLCLSWMCVWSFWFAYPVPQKSSWEVQEFYNSFFFLFFCVPLPFANKKKETKKFTRVRSVPFSWNPFFRPRRVHRLSSFYWIPLKRHIANTMAKSCGKTEWGLEGEGQRGKIPIISKQVLPSFMILANRTSSKATRMTLFWCKLHFWFLVMQCFTVW